MARRVAERAATCEKEIPGFICLDVDEFGIRYNWLCGTV